MTLRSITSLYQFFEVFPDEQSAIDHLRAIRWKDGAYCPYCGCKRVMHFSDKRTHKCHDCRQRFSIKVGTIFEDTKLPLRKWFAAIWMITSYKKGIASTTLAKDMKITQKSAWFVLHRLRYAARTKSFNRPLAGEIEVDETYFGPKEKNRTKAKRAAGAAEKPIVFGMLQRGGEIRAATIKDLQGWRAWPRARQRARRRQHLIGRAPQLSAPKGHVLASQRQSQRRRIRPRLLLPHQRH